MASGSAHIPPLAPGAVECCAGGGGGLLGPSGAVALPGSDTATTVARTTGESMDMEDWWSRAAAQAAALAAPASQACPASSGSSPLRQGTSVRRVAPLVRPFLRSANNHSR